MEVGDLETKIFRDDIEVVALEHPWNEELHKRNLNWWPVHDDIGEERFDAFRIPTLRNITPTISNDDDEKIIFDAIAEIYHIEIKSDSDVSFTPDQVMRFEHFDVWTTICGNNEKEFWEAVERIETAISVFKTAVMWRKVKKEINEDSKELVLKIARLKKLFKYRPSNLWR